MLESKSERLNPGVNLCPVSNRKANFVTGWLDVLISEILKVSVLRQLPKYSPSGTPRTEIYRSRVSTNN
jgi:hypothetical protein